MHNIASKNFRYILNKKVAGIVLDINYNGKYKSNTILPSNRCGYFKIIGKIKGSSEFLIEFLETGTEKVVTSSSISQGLIRDEYYPMKSYFGGCVGRPHKFISKRLNHFLFNRWREMIRRCYDISNKDYNNYGGRGITVQKELLCFEIYCRYLVSFENYTELMRDGFDIDRTDNDGNYEFGNMRIISHIENCHNKNRIAS